MINIETTSFPSISNKWFFISNGFFKTILGKDVFQYFGILPNTKNSLKFAFLVHPMNKQDYKFLVSDKKTLMAMERWIEREKIALARYQNGKGQKPNLVNKLYNGIGNKTIGYIKVQADNKECYGILILVPYMPEQYIEALKGNKEIKQEIINSIKAACDIAGTMGCQYIGLGAFNSIITQTKDGNILTQYTNIPITSGNDLTASGIVEGVKLAINNQNLFIKDLTITIIGASGSVGRPVSELIAELGFKKVILNARMFDKLEKTFKQIAGNDTLEISTNLEQSIKQSDIIVIAVSSTKDEFIFSDEWIKKNAIICDASRPLVMSKNILTNRPDIRIFEGAIFEIPGCTIEGYKFLRMGQPNQTYGCMASTIAYALSNETSSRGNGIIINKREAQKAMQLATKLGIKPIGIKFDTKIIF